MKSSPLRMAVVWLTVQDQNALVRFDTHAERFDPVYKDQYDGPRPRQTNTIARGPIRINARRRCGNAPRTHRRWQILQEYLGVRRHLKIRYRNKKKITNFPDVPDTYGIAVDKEGNIWGWRVYRQRLSEAGQGWTSKTNTSYQVLAPIPMTSYKWRPTTRKSRFPRIRMVCRLFRRQPDSI